MRLTGTTSVTKLLLTHNNAFKNTFTKLLKPQPLIKVTSFGSCSAVVKKVYRLILIEAW